jgi:hypothetical protein
MATPSRLRLQTASSRGCGNLANQHPFYWWPRKPEPCASYSGRCRFRPPTCSSVSAAGGLPSPYYERMPRGAGEAARLTFLVQSDMLRHSKLTAYGARTKKASRRTLSASSCAGGKAGPAQSVPTPRRPPGRSYPCRAAAASGVGRGPEPPASPARRRRATPAVCVRVRRRAMDCGRRRAVRRDNRVS